MDFKPIFEALDNDMSNVAKNFIKYSEAMIVELKEEITNTYTSSSGMESVLMEKLCNIENSRLSLKDIEVYYNNNNCYTNLSSNPNSFTPEGKDEYAVDNKSLRVFYALLFMRQLINEMIINGIESKPNISADFPTSTDLIYCLQQYYKAFDYDLICKANKFFKSNESK